MKILIPIVALCFLCASCNSQKAVLTSPNKNISVEMNGENSFVVKRKGGDGLVEVMKMNGLALAVEGAEGGFALKSCSKRKKVVDDYEMMTGKRKHCHNEAYERVYRYENPSSVAFDLVMRAYNDGVAFRFEIPEDGKPVVLTGEDTKFVFADGIERWTQEYIVGYEGFYPANSDGIGGNKSREWGMPALFHPGESTYVMLAEANALRGNTGAYLSNAADASSYEVRLLDKTLKCPAGWRSPWRVAVVGSLADVVETTLITDVSDPCKLDDTSWIKPGVVSWIYWAYNHGSKDYQIVKNYIDFAHDFKLPYVLIDWEWDVMGNGGDFNDALKYCKEKGVDPLIWYNSSTAWCGPEPLYRLNEPERRDKEMKWLSDIGIKGIKVDFFGADSVAMMNYYVDILEDAARYNLLVNFHGGTIPRGWQRTYPNYMSSEAVYGAEWYNNRPILTNKAAAHNCTLPFTRNVIGPMDYTPCAFTDSQHPHITSDAHELALLVVFESALQHLADRPSGFTSQPQEVRGFVSSLPSVWDDTKLLAGKPAESVAMARLKDGKWYVGMLNGKDEKQTVSIDWSFLGEGEWTVTSFADALGAKKEWVISTENGVKAADMPAEVEMRERGGFVAVLEKSQGK